MQSAMEMMRKNPEMVAQAQKMAQNPEVMRSNFIKFCFRCHYAQKCNGFNGREQIQSAPTESTLFFFKR